MTDRARRPPPGEEAAILIDRFLAEAVDPVGEATAPAAGALIDHLLDHGWMISPVDAGPTDSPENGPGTDPAPNTATGVVSPDAVPDAAAGEGAWLATATAGQPHRLSIGEPPPVAAEDEGGRPLALRDRRPARDELQSGMIRLTTAMDQHADLVAALQQEIDRLHRASAVRTVRWGRPPGDPIRPDEPLSPPASADGPHHTIAALEDQVANLERALDSRDTIGMAKGVLMARGHCTADEAFDVLRRASQRTNRKVSVIAAEIIAANGAAPGPGNAEYE